MEDAFGACAVHCVKLARVFRQSRRAVEGVRQHPAIRDHDIVAATAPRSLGRTMFSYASKSVPNVVATLV